VEYKIIADTLASAAALVAIVSVMASWYRSARKPLKITSVVVHKKEDETAFILVVKNVKSYPVTIKRTGCYRRKKYQVQKKLGGKPQYSELFPGSEMLSASREPFEIAANGHTDIRIAGARNLNIPGKLLFLLETSHGYHELWCKDVLIVEIGKVDMHGVEYKYEYESKRRAKALYYWKLLKDLTTRCSGRCRRSAPSVVRAKGME
jgi:hypothetical protein